MSKKLKLKDKMYKLWYIKNGVFTKSNVRSVVLKTNIHKLKLKKIKKSLKRENMNVFREDFSVYIVKE